jgi:hypothetical protein
VGKKSSAPAAPDYAPLAAASEASAKYSYELAKKQQAWAEKTYADNKEISDVVIQKAMGALDKQTADADRARQRYQTIFEPLEEQLAYDAETYASPARQEYEAGKAEADVAAQFEQARTTAAQRLEGFGVDPSQTRQGALDLGTRIAEAAAQASAGNQARTQTENIGRALRSEAINVGRGYPGQINASQQGANAAGQQGVNTGLATTASGAQTMGTGQGWQGTGNQGLATWGNILNQGYQNQMAQFEADQNASSGWGNVLGTGLGFAASFLEEGGVIPEPGSVQRFADGGQPIPEEMSPSGGAIPDDIPAEIDGQAPARLNAGEFVVPQDVVKWVGEKGMQQFILKARKELEGGNGERPAQPEIAPAGQPPMPAESVGAIPMPVGG